MCTEENNDIGCTCGHSSDGKCHCCEEKRNTYTCGIYDEVDTDEYIDQLDDWN